MNFDNIIIDGVLYNYEYTPDNVHITDSCKVSKRFFESALTGIQERHGSLTIWTRSHKSLKREWACHNLCYALDIHRDRTKDVDLNFPLKWYVSAAYWVIGAIAMLIIK